MTRALVFILLAGCAGPNASASFEEGNRLYDAGDLSSALRAYSEAIAADESLAMAWNNRGLAKAAGGDAAGALRDYDEAIRRDPSMAEAHYNRGVVHLRAGDAYRALADFSDAVRIQPQYPRALAGRGLARSRVGDKAGAATDLRKALEIAGPDWSERAGVEAELAKLSAK